MFEIPKTTYSVGERPELPLDVIAKLREARSKLADQLWDAAANATVSLFEGWRRAE